MKIKTLLKRSMKQHLVASAGCCCCSCCCCVSVNSPGGTPGAVPTPPKVS